MCFLISLNFWGRCIWLPALRCLLWCRQPCPRRSHKGAHCSAPALARASLSFCPLLCSRLPHEYPSAPPHYSWAGTSGVMCSEEEGGSVSVSESHNHSVRVCACVPVCEIDGEERGGCRNDCCYLYDRSHPNLRLQDSAGAFCASKLNVWVGCLTEMPAKEWLMRTGAPVWRVTPLCPYHHQHHCSGRIGRLALPRRL